MKPPAVPAANRTLDPPLQSTPYARGTASKAENSEDSRVTSPANILLVREDLKDKSIVHIIHFLKALLARIILHQNGNDLGSDSVFHRALIEECDVIFKEMLDVALAFCNEKEGESWDYLKRHLDEYCREPLEKDRYLPLSNALNTILFEFGRDEFGSLPVPDDTESKEQIIFMPNDPTVIESKHLFDKGDRKPDIVGMHLSTLCDIYNEYEDLDFEDMTKYISLSKLTEDMASRKPEWIDVLQVWELKAIKMKLEFLNRQWTSSEDFLNSADQVPVNTSLKRNFNNVDININSSAPKRSRASRTTASHSIRANIRPKKAPPRQPNVQRSFDEQCAMYAIDRLTAKWTILHCTVILLEDSMLSLRWYDAQGCIESEYFDFLDQLPVFIVMIMIFQRFNSYMWGISQSDDTTVEVAGRRFYLAEEPLPFQLKGRRTAATCAEPIPNNLQDTERRPTVNEMTLFFKSTWRERIRTPEYDVIKKIGNRVIKYLPEEFRKMVTDHLPTVIAAQECSKENTATIRILLQQAITGGAINVERELHGARVRTWMVTRRLEAVIDLEPIDFLRVYWDSMRCHYLLWRIGIAHSDISLNNLMCIMRDDHYSGILNDFDLATIMKPGDRNPEKKGRERTGSIGFMALDLLKHPDGKQMRWYRHDLESFLWCLLWELMEDPPELWLDGAFKQVHGMKSEFCREISQEFLEIKHDWEFTRKFIIQWILSLDKSPKDVEEDDVFGVLSRTDDSEALKSNAIKISNDLDKQKKDSDHIRLIVESARKMECFTDIPALIDISWVDLELETSNK